MVYNVNTRIDACLRKKHDRWRCGGGISCRWWYGSSRRAVSTPFLPGAGCKPLARGGWMRRPPLSDGSSKGWRSPCAAAPGRYHPAFQVSVVASTVVPDEKKNGRANLMMVILLDCSHRWLKTHDLWRMNISWFFRAASWEVVIQLIMKETPDDYLSPSFIPRWCNLKLVAILTPWWGDFN